jgi:hypothetical protein
MSEMAMLRQLRGERVKSVHKELAKGLEKATVSDGK